MAERSDGKRSDTDDSARFYSALANLAEAEESPRTYRRRVMALVQRITGRIRTRGKAIAGETGYHASTHQILALAYRINDAHVIKVREIQRSLGFTAGGVTRRLDAMIADGLIVREPDPDDGRALLARLTPAGVDLAERLLTVADEASSRLEKALTLKEWRTLARLLARLDNEMS
jgi:DNA-binding MarR family transcriptional regulator